MIVNNGYTLLDNRFYGKGQYTRSTNIFEQAGSALPVRVAASKAFEFFGEYEPEIVPMYADVKGERVESNTRGIFFQEYDKRGNYKGYKQVATVASKYELVTPKTFCNLWDNNVGLPVVAMGAKGDLGEIFYIASEIGNLPVKGTDIKCNLMGVSPMTGKGAMNVRVTPINMWCTNQLHASKSKALINARIPHKSNVIAMTALWMKHLKAEVEEAQKIIANDFNLMLQKQLTEATLKEYMDLVYLMPEVPSKLGPLEVVEKKHEQYEIEVKSVNTKREAFQHLFNGMLTGNEQYEGDSIFKAYNASVELIQYSKGDTVENKALSSLLGDRGEQIENVYSAAMVMATA